MAKFCSNCGAQNEDVAAVCGNCGAALEGGVAPAKADPMANVKALGAKVPKKLIPVIAGVAGVVVLVIIVAIVSSFGSSKSLVKKLEKSMYAGDAEATMKLVYTFDSEDLSEVIADGMESLYEDDYYIEMLEDEYGDNVKVKKVEVLDETVYKKGDEAFEDQIDMLKNYEESFNALAEMKDYDEVDFTSDMVKGVKRVTYKVTYSGEDKTDSVIKTVWLVKVKGGWKLAPSMFD